VASLSGYGNAQRLSDGGIPFVCVSRPSVVHPKPVKLILQRVRTGFKLNRETLRSSNRRRNRICRFTNEHGACAERWRMASGCIRIHDGLQCDCEFPFTVIVRQVYITKPAPPCPYFSARLEPAAATRFREKRRTDDEVNTGYIIGL